MVLEKIVAGGQTGVDRGALDAALACGVAIGGWCPRGRLAEDGRIDLHYPLQETPSADTAQRTAWNVRDSIGTLILHRDVLVGGTVLTAHEAKRLGRPLLIQHVLVVDSVANTVRWLAQNAIAVLNVAGPRESEAPGIYHAARVYLMALIGELDQG